LQDAAASAIAEAGRVVDQTAPVCGVSDGVYGVLKSGADFALGENPLVTMGLLKIRQEICGVESIVSDVVVPLIKNNTPANLALAEEGLREFAAKAVEGVSDYFDPASFTPVCGASDGLYRSLQSGALALIGEDAYKQYAPLIAAGLLRVRLEMCVLESFLTEAIVPFVKRNGFSWILPLHETVETFVAGTVFAVAINFVLLGSTKVLTVVVTYADVFVGYPLRTVSGFFIDRLDGRPLFRLPSLPAFARPWLSEQEKKQNVRDAEERAAKLEVERLASKVKRYEQRPDVLYSLFVVTKLGGDLGRSARKTVEALDLFVGRYLVLLTVGYVAFKFLHLKFWPDFP